MRALLGGRCPGSALGLKGSFCKGVVEVMEVHWNAGVLELTVTSLCDSPAKRKPEEESERAKSEESAEEEDRDQVGLALLI
jgi:hypothetical protein